MKSMFILNIKDPLVKEFIKTKGINNEDLKKRELKDFEEPDLSVDVLQLKFNYFKEKQQSIIMQYNNFLIKKENIRDDGYLLKHRSMLDKDLIGKPVLRTPKISALDISPDNSPVMVSVRSMKEKRSAVEIAEHIQKNIDKKLFVIKREYEKKKLQQLKNLNQLEYEREIKNQKLLKRLEKGNEVEKNSKKFEVNTKKFEIVRRNLEKQERELDKNLEKNIKELNLKHEKAKKILEQDLGNKIEKAREMAKSMSLDRNLLEEAKSDDKLKKILMKIEKNLKNKNRIASHMQLNIKRKHEKDKTKKDKMLKKHKIKEEEFEKKKMQIERKHTLNMDMAEKNVGNKIEKIKLAAAQHESDLMSVKTRAEKLNRNFVSTIQSIYQSKLLEDHQMMSKRIDEFIENKKGKANYKGIG